MHFLKFQITISIYDKSSCFQILILGFLRHDPFFAFFTCFLRKRRMKYQGRRKILFSPFIFYLKAKSKWTLTVTFVVFMSRVLQLSFLYPYLDSSYCLVVFRIYKLLNSLEFESNKDKITSFGEAATLCALPFGMTSRSAVCGMDILSSPIDKFSLQQLLPLFRNCHAKIQQPFRIIIIIFGSKTVDLSGQFMLQELIGEILQVHYTKTTKRKNR